MTLMLARRTLSMCFTALVLASLLSGCIFDSNGQPPASATASGPGITTQPASQTVNQGASVTFTVVASDPAASYQWLKDGVALQGATASTFRIGSVQVSDAGSYVVRVTNAAGTTNSAAATLTVQYLSITSQPQATAVTLGASATFSIVVAGAPPPTYQWLKNGNPVAGATSTSFSFTPTLADNNAQISCVVTNASGSITSAAANVTVNSAASVGDAGGVTVQKMISAAAGGSLALADGAVLSIPPGALAADTLISVTIPIAQKANARNLTYLLEPQGLAFSTPASLTLPYTNISPGVNPTFSVSSSSVSNPLRDAGGETTNWQQTFATSADKAAQTVTVPVPHFSIIFIAVDDYAYLVLDIPAQYLKPADLLFTLTNTNDKPGPDWTPGHVGMYAGSCADPSRIIEATSPPGVRATTIGTFKNDNGHIFLGPRRVLSGASGAIADSDRPGIVNYAEGKLGRPYSLVGDGSIAQGQQYSCVGLVEAAYQSVGKPVLSGFQKVFASVPLEMYRATVPVDDISVCPGDDVNVPVYAVALDPASPYYTTTLRGWYRIDASQPGIVATLKPQGSTFTAGSANRYSFRWTPTLAQAGQDFQAAFDVTIPIFATGIGDVWSSVTSVRLQQPLTIHVKPVNQCALATTIVTYFTETHTVGTTQCPQNIGNIPLTNTSCGAVTYTATSTDAAIVVAPSTGSILAGGTANLGVGFNCSKQPPVGATINITIQGANTSSQIAIPVTLNRGP